MKTENKKDRSTKNSPINKKIIIDSAGISDLVKAYRLLGKTIVLTQGSFDMVHIGHGRYCQKAKDFGDVLLVGVDSDEKVRARKGPDRPVVPQEERMEMLAYFSTVDHVVLKELSDPQYNLIKLVEPDVLVATKDTYSEESLKAVKKYCKKVVVLDPQATTSTSAKLRRLQIGMSKKLADSLIEKLKGKLPSVMESVLSEVRDGT